MGEVNDLSLFLIEALEESRTPVDMARAATALTLVRLMNPRLSEETENKQTMDLMAFASMACKGAPS